MKHAGTLRWKLITVGVGIAALVGGIVASHHSAGDIRRISAPLPTPPSMAARSIAPARKFDPSLRSDPARATALPRGPDGFLDWPDAMAASQTLSTRDQTVVEDLQAVQTMLTDYRTVFGENPEGGLNEEFTAAFLGDNPEKIRFLSPKNANLSGSGELLDRWGTPYFFHKLSALRMDLRSAGPDRKLFTADDVLNESSGAKPPL